MDPDARRVQCEYGNYVIVCNYGRADDGECRYLRNPPHLELSRSCRTRATVHYGRAELPGGHGELSNGATSGEDGEMTCRRRQRRSRLRHASTGALDWAP